MNVPDIAGGLIVRPGDTLIIRARLLTAETATEIRDGCMAQMPGLADVIIIAAEGLAVYRPEDAS